ncbi:histidine kinase, partial [Actinomadura latina]|nr:histidine kinase [Actinomadura latina]
AAKPGVPRSPREVRRRPPGGSGAAGRPALPKRVRQENMAAQLREDRSAAPTPPAEPRPSRSPEELRSMMSSIQQGTRRGRAEALDTEES